MFLKNHDSKAPSGAKCKVERSNHKVTKPKKHHQKDGHVGVIKDLPKVAIKARCTPSRHIVTIHPRHVHPGQCLGAAAPAGSQNLVLSGEDGQVPHNPCQLSFNPCHQKSAKRSEAHHRIGLHQQNPLEEAAGAEEEEDTFETLLTRVLQRKRRPTGASCTGKPRRRRKVSRSDFKSLMDNH